MKQRITLKKIAKEFDVSISTVSKALKDSPEIGVELKERIQGYASFYNYKPNNLALQLRNQKTKVIGVIVPEIVHHFFSTVIDGVEEYANKNGYNVMVCLSNESHTKEVENVNILTNGSVDGLIVSLSRETLEMDSFEHFSRLLSDDFPVVLFDRVHDALFCDKVIIDDVGGAYKAVNHLLDEGAKRVALLTTQDFVTVGQLRKDGYERALLKQGVAIEDELIFKIDDSKDLKSQISQVFKMQNPPDAILAVNEIYAAHALSVANELSISVPNDLSIIGFTSGMISEFTHPPLSSVVQHGFLIGTQAAELLINRIESEKTDDFQTEVISPDLKLRRSTKN